jgi:hypothetical protein
MQLPDSKMLARRIEQLVASSHLDDNIAAKLLATNQADEQYRAGTVWFCLFRPGIAGQSGIGSFFRFWGGKTLQIPMTDSPGPETHWSASASRASSKPRCRSHRSSRMADWISRSSADTRR